ncbi:ANM_collapsed_G0054160.mRNA.1.CDS.1 [Saccharomyces cerevisiae]|nr:ANM_collapsed_G0054160.mRNA.1.CDS.1 [Saccharomyces cerevisiae]
MKKLNLSNNEINGIIDFEQLIPTNNSVVGGWLTVEVLDLSNNNIIGVRNINCLPCLKVLNLNGNPLVSIVESSKMENGTLRALSIKKYREARYPNYKITSWMINSRSPTKNLKILKLDGFAQLSKWQNGLPLCKFWRSTAAWPPLAAILFSKIHQLIFSNYS